METLGASEDPNNIPNESNIISIKDIWRPGTKLWWYSSESANNIPIKIAPCKGLTADKLSTEIDWNNKKPKNEYSKKWKSKSMLFIPEGSWGRLSWGMWLR